MSQRPDPCDGCIAQLETKNASLIADNAALCEQMAGLLARSRLPPQS